MRWTIPALSGCLALALGSFLVSESQAQVPYSRDSSVRAKINSWSIGLVAGRIEGAPLKLAAELAQVFDNGDEMRVLPIVSRGPFDNVNDIVYLRGVDLGIVYGDVLEHFRSKEPVPNLLERVQYVTRLFSAEVHILVRPEINSLKDLAGKQVNMNTQGTAAAYTGPLIFQRLNIPIKATFDPHRQVLQDIRKDSKYAGMVWVTTKPVPPLAAPNWPEGFKLLPIEYSRELEDLYEPSYLEASEYPKLVPAGQRLNTVAVPVVLATYNWRPGQDRYQRMARFVDYLFERLPQLQKEPNDAVWKQVSLSASVPGWRRYTLMQAKLDSMKGSRPPTAEVAPARK